MAHVMGPSPRPRGWSHPRGAGVLVAGLFTAPLRRPRLHVHLGAPVRLSGTLAEATAQAHTALTAAWVIAATLAGSNG
jgi:hypothetical protein